MELRKGRIDAVDLYFLLFSNEKLQKWFSFDFGEESAPGNNQRSTKKPRMKSKSCGNIDTPAIPKRTFNFEAALAPKTQSDLAVHPKKLKDLETWLNDNVVNKNRNEMEASFLLLTGPTGCGKTASLNILCKKLGISISEWINPVDQDFDVGFRSNQVERFTEFLTESRWNSLFEINGNSKIVLVEDFPNAIAHRPEEFFNILEECSFKTRHPVVFICTDSLMKSGIQLSQSLFPQEIRDRYGIFNISFNACADTLLRNALRRAQKIVESNQDLLKFPSINTVSAIVASSMGDIRCAINQYYMAALIDSKELPVEVTSGKTGSKRKRQVPISKVVSMNRDESLGLFHGLGRVFNPKRLEAEGDSWRLHCDVGKLIDEFSTQPSTFTAFLFENYIKYFGDLYEVAMASDTLSLSQKFLDSWNDKNDTMIFALWISVLGVMVANEHRLSKWTPIKGPRKMTKELNQDAQTQKMSPTDHYYYNIINKTDRFHKFTLKR